MEVLKRLALGVVLALGLILCTASGVLLANLITFNAMRQLQPPPPPPPRAGAWDPFKNYSREA